MLTRVGTARAGKKDYAIVVEADGRRVCLLHADLAQYPSVVAIEAELERQASEAKVELPRLFVHVNRDGSIALATGEEPRTWPEDESRREERRL